ncbi:SET domain-containing protein [Pluteus cervinus]|uniref:SET domain-containing protein n=1 Tax=Pluteus cervinus TaxID=181527 RepID=A0ACD3AFY0_9AGAR|nr:SET domain-containing protein [Pluteus cervinus]
MSWRSYRANLANFPPKHSLAKNLPHSLQDLINSMDESSRRLLGMRHVFEAAILENTSADEPEAPPIQVINDVDDDPAPPWEFHYSNQMWHTDDVPAPDMQNLVSCKCIGKCDPKKGNCACAERQKQQANGTILDFAYDRNRRLKAFEYPIFECNELCACGDDCRNRVVQHGRMVTVNITKTVDKGWGVFAGNKRIPTGTFIGIYAGELITDAEGEERGIKYDQSGRTYLFDLDFHHLKSGNPNWTTKYVVDAYHAGNFTRFLNHSCDPNCSLYPCYVNEANIDKPHLAIFALRDIEPFEEICFSYWGNPNDLDGDNDGDEENPLDIVHSRCKCGASNCTGRVFK